MMKLFFLSYTFALGLIAHLVDASQNHQVTVGENTQLKFVPEFLNAQIGDTVTYTFFSKNHSVTQSSFTDPCHPLAGGFFSGFTPTSSNTVASETTWTITINDTKPIWAYCGQTNGNHCQSGMVHAINA
jgi:plastocyanin